MRYLRLQDLHKSKVKWSEQLLRIVQLMLVLCMCGHCSDIADKYGYGVVEHFVGHGVGAVFHSGPSVLHARKFSVPSAT